jgi:hypothetical protein
MSYVTGAQGVCFVGLQLEFTQEWDGVRHETIQSCGMNKKELLRRAAEERELIVSRYSRGREDGAQIDPWEDPTFEIYHVTDRYGFIQ